MNPFLLSSSERLAHWRQFRASLVGLLEIDRLAAVTAFWANAPLSVVDVRPRPPWPTIWQMLHANIWTRDSVAVGMEATLRLIGVAADRMTLRCISLVPDELLVLVIDETWLLNYDWGSFRLYTTVDHSILGQWRFIGKDYRLI